MNRELEIKDFILLEVIHPFLAAIIDMESSRVRIGSLVKATRRFVDRIRVDALTEAAVVIEVHARGQKITVEKAIHQPVEHLVAVCNAYAKNQVAQARLEWLREEGGPKDEPAEPPQSTAE